MSLVNVSLKFQTLILQIQLFFVEKCENPLHWILTFFQQKINCYFLLKNVRILCTAKDSHIFSTKNNSALQRILTFFQQKIKVADICFTNLCLNDIVS